MREVFSHDRTLTMCAQSDPQDIPSAVISKYTALAKDLYSRGFHSFMNGQSHTKDDAGGSTETIYMHCLRYYLPMLIQETYYCLAKGKRRLERVCKIKE